MTTSTAEAQVAEQRELELRRLGDEIAELAAHVTAATARLLDLIREFDARGGWGDGFRSCAEWLTWRIGLAPNAAREHVRVARALGSLPRLAAALATGELSYSKVRALTRVASADTEERLLKVGKAATAAHVERISVPGATSIAKRKSARPLNAIAHARSMCIKTKTAWSSFVRGWSRRQAPCSCKPWPRPGRRFTSLTFPREHQP